jgi:hypothetical protein
METGVFKEELYSIDRSFMISWIQQSIVNHQIKKLVQCQKNALKLNSAFFLFNFLIKFFLFKNFDFYF